jgi:hypothetical protein
MKNEIIIYAQNELAERIEVRMEQETFWLTQLQISNLFERDRTVITKHLKNIFLEKELDEKVVCAFFAHTTQHGAMLGKTQQKNSKYYNLDVILSVGYRVNSKRGTQFRIWANQVLKEHLLKGFSINNRMNSLENQVYELKDQLSKIDIQLQTQLPHTQGVFFDGQVFDAYVFVNDLIKSANHSIILIDNYLDESSLLMLSKRKETCKAIIYTQKINALLKLDLAKHNQQYSKIEIYQFNSAHDRFLIIDEKELYHIGASLKDLGKKWFAISKLNEFLPAVLEKLNNKNSFL